MRNPIVPLALVALLSFPAASFAEPADDTASRAELAVVSSSLALTLSIMGAESLHVSGQAGTGFAMLSTGGALFASLALSSGKPVPAALPVLLSAGAGWGFFTAAMLESHLATMGGDPMPGLFVGSLLGTGLGAAASATMDLTGGDAAGFAFGSMFGGSSFLLSLMAARAYDLSAPTVMTLSWLASAGGAALGYGLNQDLHASRSRWSMLGLSSAVGAFSAAGLLMMIGTSSDQLAAATVLGGSWAGFGLGLLLTEDWDASEPAARRTTRVTPSGLRNARPEVRTLAERQPAFVAELASGEF